MPEFILDTGDRENALKYKALDSFTQGFIEAMFFTSTGTGDDAENGLQEASISDLSPATWDKILALCATFQEANRELIEAAIEHGGREREPYNETRAGHDYWYTSQGHGTGYWDRGLGDIGEELAKVARYHEMNFYRGDDGLIYLD